MRRNLVPIASASILYATSLALPAFDCGLPNTSFPGYAVLAMGWLGVLTLDPRWFANPLLLVLIWRLAKDTAASHKFLPIATVILALSAIPFRAPGCEGGAGAPEMSSALAVGGYVWVSAMLVASGACLLRATQKPHETTTNRAD